MPTSRVLEQSYIQPWGYKNPLYIENVLNKVYKEIAEIVDSGDVTSSKLSDLLIVYRWLKEQKEKDAE